MDLSRFKAFVNKTHFNKGMRGVFFDEMHQRVVATDGHMTLMVKADVIYTRIINLKGEQMFEPFPFWKVVFPKYKMGLNIDLKELMAKLTPFAKLCNKGHVEMVGLEIDEDIIYFNSKMLSQGLKALQSKTATLYYDGRFRGITFHTDGADLLIMPVNIELANVIVKYETLPMTFEPFDLSDQKHFYHAFGRGLNNLINRYEVGEIEKDEMIKKASEHVSEISNLVYDHRYAPYLNNVLFRAQYIIFG